MQNGYFQFFHGGLLHLSVFNVTYMSYSLYCLASSPRNGCLVMSVAVRVGKSKVWMVNLVVCILCAIFFTFLFCRSLNHLVMTGNFIVMA